MMRPIVIAEYYQTRRQFALVLAVHTTLTLLLCSFGGCAGVFAVMAGLTPFVGVSLGAGTFAEEFSKGQLRFLYTLPVRRTEVWLVKCASGLLCMLLLIGVSCVVLFTGSRAEMPQILSVLSAGDLSADTILAVLLAGALYGFFVGCFCITLCSSGVTAALLQMILAYLPTAVLALLSIIPGLGLSIQGVVAVLLAAAGSYLVGACVLFRLRNPFLDTHWTRRLVGAGCAGAAWLVMLLVGAAAMSLPMPARAPDFTRVLDVQASPDGGRAFVVMDDGFLRSHGYVIASDGTIVCDFGPDVGAAANGRITWRPTPGGYSVAYTGFGPPLPLPRWLDYRPHHSLFVTELDTGQTVTLPNLEADDSRAYYSYSCWSADGVALFGFRHEWSGGRAGVTLFSQAVPAGGVEETRLSMTGSGGRQLSSGRVVIRDESPPVQDDRFESTSESEPDSNGLGIGDMAPLTIIEPSGNRWQTRAFPPGCIEVEVHPVEPVVMLLSRQVEGDVAGFEIVRRDESTGGQSVLVGAARLPRQPVHRAIQSCQDYVDISLSPRGRWLTVCAVHASPTPTRELLLVDSSSGCLHSLVSTANKGYPQLQLSPDESRALVTLDLQDRADATNENPSGPDREAIIVFSLDGDAPEEIYRAIDDADAREYHWFGRDRILMLRRVTRDEHELRGGRELRILDLATGTQSPVKAKPADNTVLARPIGGP